jgi:murein L,D-transpeptidase YafK
VLCALILILALASGAWTQTVPASRRSREALARVTPRLTAALREKDLSLGSPMYVRVFKLEKQLEVWIRRGGDYYEHFKTYPICAYSGGLGPKLKDGDHQSPEGFYQVRPAQMNPLSRFHLSIDLGYPNAYDRANKRTGSGLMVHGNCVSVGCYAMTDAGIEEIYALADAALRAGQSAIPFHLFPFRPTHQNLRAYPNARWAPFWADLKRAYDIFARRRQPAEVTVRNGRYVIDTPE